MIMSDPTQSPNVWYFLSVAIQVAGTAFAGWLAYLGVIKPRLTEIHTLVNGNLSAEKEDNANLREVLKINGIEAPPRVAPGPLAPPK